MPFVAPDLSGPLDWDARTAQLPGGATVRGMFLTEVAGGLKKWGHVPVTGERSFIAFKSYPAADYFALLRQYAEAVHPQSPPHQALLEFGRQVYPRFEATLVGRTIFAFAGRKFTGIVKAASKAYEVSIEPGRVAVLEVREGFAKVALQQVWSFPESLQIGVWQGAMQVAGVQGQIAVDVHGPHDATYEITW